MNSFKSDFRFVADYFVQMQRNKDYIASRAAIQHVHEVLQLMAVMTGDSRYIEIYSSEMERRPISMCEVLDKIEARGEARGYIEACRDVGQLSLTETIQKIILRFHLSPEEATEIANKYW